MVVVVVMMMVEYYYFSTTSDEKNCRRVNSRDASSEQGSHALQFTHQR